MKLVFMFLFVFGSSFLYSGQKDQPVHPIKVNEICATKCTTWYQMTKSLMGNNISQRILWQAYESCLTKCITVASDKQDKKEDKN